MASNGEPTLYDRARATMMERMWAILAHDHNEKTRMDRATAAKGKGLPEADFATLYPGGQQTTTVTNNGVGTRGIVATAIAAAAIPGALAGYMLLKQPTSAQPSVPVAATAQSGPAPAPAGWSQKEMVEQELQPDGTWKDKRSLGKVLVPTEVKP